MSHDNQGLEARIKIAKKTNNETVGKIEFLYSGKSIRFTNPFEMIKAYKESINIYGISGVSVKVVEGNPDLAYDICAIQYGEFGEEPPSKEDFFTRYNMRNKEDEYIR